jgi:hypothetical protein
MHVDVLAAFTIHGLVEPDVARLSVALLPVKSYHVRQAQAQPHPRYPIPAEGWTVDGPHIDLRA